MKVDHFQVGDSFHLPRPVGAIVPGCYMVIEKYYAPLQINGLNGIGLRLHCMSLTGEMAEFNGDTEVLGGSHARFMELEKEDADMRTRVKEFRRRQDAVKQKAAAV